MAEPTEHDREKADLIVDRINWIVTSPEDVRADIAQALADERQAAEDRVVAAEAERDALKVERDGLRESLELIERLHIPDQPAAHQGSELVWAQRHVASLRRIARAALSPPKQEAEGV
jgi:hypothetical protein